MNQPIKLSRDLPSREAITQHQVHTVLAVMGTLIPYILQPHQESNIPTGHKMDGGTAACVQATLINACNRLDQILTDEGRWDMKATQTLESQAAEVLQRHKTLLEEQIIATKIINLPHNRFRPDLYQLEDGTYVAELGDLVAAGESPAQAMLAFDMLFNGQIDSAMFEFLKEREKAIDEGQPLPPTPKKRKKK